jgi:hypothetical protein
MCLDVVLLCTFQEILWNGNMWNFSSKKVHASCGFTVVLILPVREPVNTQIVFCIKRESLNFGFLFINTLRLAWKFSITSLELCKWEWETSLRPPSALVTLCGSHAFFFNRWDQGTKQHRKDLISRECMSVQWIAAGRVTMFSLWQGRYFIFATTCSLALELYLHLCIGCEWK